MLKNAGRNKEKSASFDALFLCQNAEISSLKISVLHGEKTLYILSLNDIIYII